MSFLGCFGGTIDGDSWFTWWFNHLRGPSICPQWASYGWEAHFGSTPRAGGSTTMGTLCLQVAYWVAIARRAQITARLVPVAGLGIPHETFLRVFLRGGSETRPQGLPFDPCFSISELSMWVRKGAQHGARCLPVVPQKGTDSERRDRRNIFHVVVDNSTCLSMLFPSGRGQA